MVAPVAVSPLASEMHEKNNVTGTKGNARAGEPWRSADKAAVDSFRPERCDGDAQNPASWLTKNSHRRLHAIGV
jgi:hypothetical protein